MFLLLFSLVGISMVWRISLWVQNGHEGFPGGNLVQPPFQVRPSRWGCSLMILPWETAHGESKTFKFRLGKHFLSFLWAQIDLSWIICLPKIFLSAAVLPRLGNSLNFCWQQQLKFLQGEGVRIDQNLLVWCVKILFFALEELHCSEQLHELAQVLAASSHARVLQEMSSV